MLDERRIQNALGERPFRWHAQTGSTNDDALDWLKRSAPAGAMVLADEQLRGRGRHGRAWRTPAGSALALSLVLRPAAEELPRLTMAGALAIAEMADAVGAPEVSLKWPNDVLAGGRKLAGVLCEAQWRGGELQGAALGLGVNVRTDFCGGDLEGRATALEQECGRRLDRAQLLTLLVGRLDCWLDDLAGERLFGAWRARLGLVDAPVVINGRRGIVVALMPDGALVLRDDEGAVHRFYSGDLMQNRRAADGR